MPHRSYLEYHRNCFFLSENAAFPNHFLLGHVSLQSSSSSLSFWSPLSCFSLKSSPLLLGHSETPKQSKNSLILRQWFLIEGNFATKGIWGGGLEIYFGYHSWRGWLLLTSNRRRPGMLLNIYPVQHSPQTDHQCQSVPHGQAENLP